MEGIGIGIFNMESKDWWDELSAEEQAEIDTGLAEADNGETIPHEEL